MKVLFFDLSLTVGVAVTNPKTPGMPATFRIDVPAPAGKNFGGPFAFFHRRVVEILREYKPELVGYEALIDPQVLFRRNSPVTTRILGGLAAYVEGTAWEFDVPVESVHPTTIKTYWTGSGRADKAAMIARCQQLKWDIGRPPDHNLADACGGWSLLMARHDPKFQIAPRRDQLL